MAARPSAPLLGRTILVTACASPIGKAVALRLASEGANLCLTDPSKTDGGEVCQELRATYPQSEIVFQVGFELTDATVTKKFVVAAAKALKRLDGLAHCAYHDAAGPRLHETDRTQLDQLVAANQTSAVNVAQPVLQQFLVQSKAKLAEPEGGYSIVLLGSVASATSDTSPIYAAASAYVRALSRSIARDYAQDDIRSNVVSVGPLETPLVQSFIRGDYDLSNVPMRRAAKPDEVAATMAFLLGSGASYTTGAVIPVDGGASS